MNQYYYSNTRDKTFDAVKNPMCGGFWGRCHDTWFGILGNRFGLINDVRWQISHIVWQDIMMNNHKIWDY